jgi:hypothetical protein
MPHAEKKGLHPKQLMGEEAVHRHSWRKQQFAGFYFNCPISFLSVRLLKSKEL